jgi:hypothetical protein
MTDLTESQKWLKCFLYALVFLLISSPFVYKITGSLTHSLGFTTSNNGCPNIYGLLLHTLVFLLLARCVMLIPLSKK